MKELVNQLAEILGHTGDQVRMKSRSRHYIFARQMICAVLREDGKTWQEIADSLGRTNHTTAMNWFQNHDELNECNWNGYRFQFQKFRRQASEVMNNRISNYDFSAMGGVVYAPV